MQLMCLLRAAQLNEGLSAGFFRAEAGADAGVGVQGDVAFNFGGEVVVGAASAE
jgi:hypothetical protein